MQVSATYSALLTAKFDFAIDDNSGKWSTPQQSWKYSTLRLAKVSGVEADYPYSVVDTRLRVRGTGRVVVMRYESEAGKDFELIGRVTPFTAETEG
ncbi:MAG: hypothetical protein V3T88_03480 [Nitrosomonadaceae bacterium]